MITRQEYLHAKRIVSEYERQAKEVNQLDRIKSRKREYVYRRIIKAYTLFNKGYSLSEIGRLMDKHHTTIIYYIRRYDELVRYDDFKQLM